MKITKYRLIPQYQEEVEFVVTKVTKFTRIESHTSTTDEFGNAISTREKPNVSVETQTDEGIMAISLPSRLPARVEIIETLDTNSSVSSNDTSEQRTKPVDIGNLMRNEQGLRNNDDNVQRPANINMSRILNSDSMPQQEAPQAGQFTWSDGSKSK